MTDNTDPVVNDATNPESEASTEQTDSHPRLIKTALLLAAIGGVAGLAASPIVERYEKHFPMANLTPEETNLIRADPDDPEAWGIERQNRWDALFRNSALCLGIFGAILGTFLGISECLMVDRRSHWVFVLSLTVLLGAVGGVLAGVAEASIGVRMQDNRDADPLPYSIGMHVSAFVLISLGVAVGLALTTRGRSVIPRAVAGGLLSGVVFAPLASILFPLYRTDLPIPEGLVPKLFFLGVAGALIGLSVARAPVRSVPNSVED